MVVLSSYSRATILLFLTRNCSSTNFVKNKTSNTVHIWFKMNLVSWTNACFKNHKWQQHTRLQHAGRDHVNYDSNYLQTPNHAWCFAKYSKIRTFVILWDRSSDDGVYPTRTIVGSTASGNAWYLIPTCLAMREPLTTWVQKINLKLSCLI